MTLLMKDSILSKGMQPMTNVRGRDKWNLRTISAFGIVIAIFLDTQDLGLRFDRSFAVRLNLFETL